MKIKLGGIEFELGKSRSTVKVSNSSVTINGKKVMDIDKDTRSVKLEVLGAPIDIVADVVEVTGDVQGDITADIVTCGDVGGDVEADMVTCGKVKGNVQADMSVSG